MTHFAERQGQGNYCSTADFWASGKQMFSSVELQEKYTVCIQISFGRWVMAATGQ
jgi:hypothetical protein